MESTSSTTLNAQCVSDKEIIRQSKEFVRGLLGDKNTKDQCCIVSTALAGYLSWIGIECESTEGLFDGWHHWWVELEDGRVIDGTANQFEGHRNYWLEHSDLHRMEI